MRQHLFSTKTFSPGHVLGGATLLFGTIAITKLLIARHRTKVAELTAAAPARGVYR